VCPALGSEAQDERERVVDRPKLARGEAPRRSSESFAIDDSRLFDEDAGFVPAQRNRRAKACWKRLRGGRGAGSRNTSPRTNSARPARCEFGHLFAHDSHLFAVFFVGGKTADLLA
jgi:hypothetical protein